MKFVALLLLALAVLSKGDHLDHPDQYQFSYSTGTEGPAQMFRQEQKGASGLVTGRYGYVDPYGTLRVVQYEAGPEGFLARGDVGPDQEAMRIARLMAEEDYKEKLPFIQYWNQVAARTAHAPDWAHAGHHHHAHTHTVAEKLQALNPPATQDWSSGKAVSSFMQSVGYAPKAAAVQALPVVPALPAPAKIQPGTAKQTASAYKAAYHHQPHLSGAHTHVTLNQGGADGFKYHYSY